MEARQWHERGRGRGPQPDLLRRQAATAATYARFHKKAFNWQKSATCAHLARFHVAKMGHLVPSLPPFRSPLGARKALAAMGYAGMGDLLADRFPRIAPAEMLLGDLAVFPDGGVGFDAVMVCGGNKLFGWWGDFDRMALLDLVDAWGSEIPANDETPELAGRTVGDVVRVFRL